MLSRPTHPWCGLDRRRLSENRSTTVPRYIYATRAGPSAHHAPYFRP